MVHTSFYDIFLSVQNEMKEVCHHSPQMTHPPSFSSSQLPAVGKLKLFIVLSSQNRLREPNEALPLSVRPD